MKNSRLTKILLIPAVAVAGLVALAMGDRPHPLKAPYVINFEKAAELDGITVKKLVKALSVSHPVTGTKVWFDGTQIFPPIKSKTMGLVTAGTPSGSESSKGGGQPSSVHVSQCVGFNSAADVQNFIDAFK